jgi:hypothetical protein
MKLETNPCIRCGKERIKDKEQTVILNASKTKVTYYICPDKECQKIVSKQIKEKEEKKLALINRSKERRNNRQTNQKEKSAKK